MVVLIFLHGILFIYLLNLFIFLNAIFEKSEVNTTLILEMCAHQDVGNHLFCLVTFETFISSEPDPSSDYVVRITIISLTRY